MNILHVLRSPVGGLFRHVKDLSRGQTQLGHRVGMICDSSTGGDSAAQSLLAMQPYFNAGITTLPINRLPALSDMGVITRCAAVVRAQNVDIIHGHGAKGGLIARVVGKKLGIPSVYTPHGGSLHYSWRKPTGAFFLAAEKILSRFGTGFVFVCDFEKEAFEHKIGLAGKPAIVAHNGLWPEEFNPVLAGGAATDLLFVGEVRHLKGIDLLLEAMIILRPKRPLTLTVVGDGPELQKYMELVKTLGLTDVVTFAGRLPIRDALTRGQLMVVPSRNESFPYVVLETAAAGVPILATDVGGITEILPAAFTCKATAVDIASHIDAALTDRVAARSKSKALALQLTGKFAAEAMAKNITDFYKLHLR